VVKWNRTGSLLVSAGLDRSAIVWDARTGDVKQHFDPHCGAPSRLASDAAAAPIIDADWRNNSSFATCATDKLIVISKVGDDAPQKVFRGHTVRTSPPLAGVA
jgi:transducin (beta)-like 1